MTSEREKGPAAWLRWRPGLVTPPRSPPPKSQNPTQRPAGGGASADKHRAAGAGLSGTRKKPRKTGSGKMPAGNNKKGAVALKVTDENGARCSVKELLCPTMRDSVQKCIHQHSDLPYCVKLVREGYLCELCIEQAPLLSFKGQAQQTW